MSNRPPVNTDGRIPSYNPVNGISGVMPEIFHTFIMLINLWILPNVPSVDQSDIFLYSYKAAKISLYWQSVCQKSIWCLGVVLLYTHFKASKGGDIYFLGIFRYSIFGLNFNPSRHPFSPRDAVRGVVSYPRCGWFPYISTIFIQDRYIENSLLAFRFRARKVVLRAW